MYKVYKFDSKIYKSITVVGDIHGEFSVLKHKIKSCKIENSLIIIAGDCGFGFNKEKYYTNIYNEYKNLLSDKNVTILFVRGNHDDPEYFDGKKIDFDNFKAVPDYSIINLGVYNILAVGGAISIDRVYRTVNKNYWVNEIPVFRPEIIQEITDDGIKINAIISHTTTSFAPLLTKAATIGFMKLDENLSDDLDYERSVMDDIYNYVLKVNKHPLTKWVYGHYHQTEKYTSEDGVEFVMLDRIRTEHNSWQTEELVK